MSGIEDHSCNLEVYVSDLSFRIDELEYTKSSSVVVSLLPVVVESRSLFFEFISPRMNT